MISEVLVIDADCEAAIPELLRAGNAQVGWVVEPNGMGGLSRLRRSRPDLVIVNLQLPDMCGTRLVERIRKGRPNQVIVVTSNSSSVLCEKVARSLGVIAYLPKPVDVQVLEAVISGAIQGVGGWMEQAV